MPSDFWDTDKLLEQMHKEQLAAAQKAFDDAKAIAANELSKTLAEDIQIIYEASVSTWYQAYIPYEYDRTYRLYQVLSVIDKSTDGNLDVGWSMSDDPLNYMSWGGGSFNGYLQIFEVGFHGGWIRTGAQNVGEHVDGAAEITGGLRWPVQSTPIPELFDGQIDELVSEYSGRLLKILEKETLEGYQRYYKG